MLLDASISELARGLRKRDFSSADLIKECYENIEKINPVVNALITVTDKDKALKNAREKDQQLNKSTSPLHGIPFVLKDAYVTKGIKTTAASKVLETYTPQYSATVYQKLLDAGAILVGKANMDAWGHGATSENTDFGPVKNPWDITRVAGGSTGGVAAAISTRMAAFGIGEDTGGSIRNPAAWCNITGLKVTYGRVSRYGCIAYASSFDTVGPMAKTVEDCALILQMVAGKDPRDATSSPQEVPVYAKTISEKTKEKIIGVPQELFNKDLHAEIKQSLLEAIKLFEKLGYKIKDISMSMISYGIPVYYLIAPSETSSNLARYDGIRFGLGRANFTRETMRRIMIGTYALSAGYYDAYYKKAQQVRTLFIKEYDKALTECDVLLMPVTPIPPTKIGETTNDPIKNWLIDVFTVTQNPVGVPSLALPCGFTGTNLPIGLQIVGKMFSESLIFQIGHAYQQASRWHLRRPNIIK